MTIDNRAKQEITEALKQLKDNNSSMRVEAARKLGAIGISHPQIIERLQSIALNDSSIDVRNVANQSLEHLQPTPLSSKPQIIPMQTQPGELSLANEKAIIELLRKQNEILENLRFLIYQSTEARTEKEYRLRTRIVDIDMSISSIANLMFKWFIASIPVGIVVGFIIFFLSACLAALGR